MRQILLGAVLMVTLMVVQAHAGPCRDNYWQPTFVHDLQKPDGPYYVMPDISFSKLNASGNPPNWVADACNKIGTYGLRDRRGFTDCQNYTRVQCGCDSGSWGNSTCAQFLRWRGYRP